MTKETEKKWQEFRALQAHMNAYHYVMAVVGVDGATAAPKESYRERGEHMATLAQDLRKIYINDETEALLDYLESHMDELSKIENREVFVFRESYNMATAISDEEAAAYSILANESFNVWREAKEKADFNLFAPILEKMFAEVKRRAEVMNPGYKGYDALLQTYAKGLTTERIDKFIDEVKEPLKEMCKKIIPVADSIDDSFLHQYYPIEKQKELNNYVASVLGADDRYFAFAETVHPFMSGQNIHDVRVTAHFYEDNVAQNLISIIHELGHALYELNIDPALSGTCLASSASFGVHESQSRFMENRVGKTKEFVELIYPKLLELFPEQLKDVSPEQFYLAINKVTPGPVRLKADELTYCFHIIIRYEIERDVTEGRLAVRDIPKAWNRRYKEYLNIDVENDGVGCLQDSHWSNGQMGYFMVYLLGSAYDAHFAIEMEKEFSIAEKIKENKVPEIVAWLTEKVHRKGYTEDPDDILLAACGGPLDGSVYIKHLKEKFSELYNIDL